MQRNTTSLSPNEGDIDSQVRERAKNNSNRSLDKLLGQLEESLTASLVTVEEQVNLARSLKNLAYANLNHLEEELLGFEDEVRRARKAGELTLEEVEAIKEEAEAEEREDEEEGGENGKDRDEDEGNPYSKDTDEKRNKRSLTETSIKLPEKGLVKKTTPRTATVAKRRNSEADDANRDRRTSRTNRRSTDSNTSNNSNNNGEESMGKGDDLSIFSQDRVIPPIPAPLPSPSVAIATSPLESINLHAPTSPPTAIAGGDEPIYCTCRQVSFGEMIACDNPACDIEWFHYGCVGLTAPPPGKWFCPRCAARKALIDNGERMIDKITGKQS